MKRCFDVEQPDGQRTALIHVTRPSPSRFFVIQMTTILRHGVISGFTLIATRLKMDIMNAVSKGMMVKAVDVFVI